MCFENVLLDSCIKYEQYALGAWCHSGTATDLASGPNVVLLFLEPDNLLPVVLIKFPGS